MLRVGLTGGMACGKTVVAGMFERRGARVIQADSIAHELMRPGEQVYADIVRHFGPEILSPDGTIDRARLAQAVFTAAPATRVDELNEIVHPAVIRKQEEWMDEISGRDPHGVAIVEAALIFEAGVGGRFDRTVVVTCEPEQKIERFSRRANLNERVAQEEVQRRSAAQLSDAEKASRADYLIDNSGSLDETGQQVDRIWRELKALAENG
jgi:dephospho-CoA kinase